MMLEAQGNAGAYADDGTRPIDRSVARSENVGNSRRIRGTEMLALVIGPIELALLLIVIGVPVAIFYVVVSLIKNRRR
jgi:hypothetical protein